MASVPGALAAPVVHRPPLNIISILFSACLEKEHGGGNRVCLVESLGLTCTSITLLLAADSPKMWLQCHPGHSYRPSAASQYDSQPAWQRSIKGVIVSRCLVESLSLTCVSITLLSVADSPEMWLQYLER